ncbi:kinase-like protein, partial [Myriangium duriaei CBS 260.36]
MDSSHLDPFSATESRSKQVQDAKDMQQIVLERANRAGTVAPPYDFLELIGKGSFGRVYKCKHRATREVVAVKIIDVDDLDYQLDNSQKDEAIEDFIKEVNTLKQVKDSKAKNINHIQEAFDLHSQLWIVSDYCSGGSVHTLMKASDQAGLEERYIIPIARELAIALKHVHDAGVIHRDLKCGNVLISEDGHLQLCDFGVSAVVENDASKRSTIIGTPYWMAPEMHDDQEYGQEIDCWAYGCTLFEMATGMPPNHKFHPQYLKQVLKSAPRLEEDQFSQGLRDFVAFCLQENPEDRPKAQQIVEHPYIANTEEEYPTSSLQCLIDRYVQWEYKGGQRMSLFNAMGAAAPQLSSNDQQASEDNWIFSTTANFDKGY